MKHEHKKYINDELNGLLGGLRKGKEYKFIVDRRNRVITFASNAAFDGEEDGRVVVGIAKCMLCDKFDEKLGKLIAVRKALRENIDDLLLLVEPDFPTDRNEF